MPENRDGLFEKLNSSNRDRHSLRRIVTGISLVVVLLVFWSLKLTGIGVAGEAFCGKAEHDHSEDCLEKTLICVLDEAPPHVHGESCLLTELICTAAEAETHVHTDDCWCIGPGFGCGQTEAEGHVHTADCLTAETRLGCGLEATEGHAHTDTCYEISGDCSLEEHTHTENCYSDITADLETAEDWEKSLADLVRGPTVRENLVLVARSQLGNRESERNFQVDALGVRRGITRYGQWYGNPYGDWSAMFVSFCLQYAGAQDAPFNAGAEALRLEWEKAGLYREAKGYTPQVGDLLFLRVPPSGSPPGDIVISPIDETFPIELPTVPPEEPTTPTEAPNADTSSISIVYPARTANAVAVITQVSDDTLTVIRGDLDNAVAETTCTLTDAAIIGYGLTPEAALNAADPPAGSTLLASGVNYNANLISDENLFVFYTTAGSDTYAIDGTGKAVPVYIDSNGQIYTDLADPNQLLWSITSYNSDSWAIQNLGSGRYLHPFYNGANDNGIITPGRWGTSINAVGTGVNFSHSAYLGLDLAGGTFKMVRNQSENVNFQVGLTQRCTLWLDGTAGGMDHLGGSPNTAYTVQQGTSVELPSQWTSPGKYSYVLRGWYDVTNARYYLPGETMQVTGNAVLYADWVAATYDIGQFNAQVADTVSTNSFITTHMFDYNYLFNIHSSRVQGTVTPTGHSETWSMVTSGAVAHGGQETFDFIFVDNDSGGRLCIPNNRSSHNVYPGAGIVTMGIYTPALGQLLFGTDNCYDPATGTGVLGKTYLGTGDHLFQIMDNPNDEHYGYYYYDSRHNAASYSQSRGRFYVYDYLSATSDSIGSAYSDFLPLNSPYANTNGKTVGTYNYDGVDGEYVGIPHYRYDSKYDSGNYNSANNVHTNYAYGMRSDIRFYLPNDPGSGGNKDLYGNDIVFEFTGDDDLWILIDGTLVLDIGGIHGAEAGIIDFSTGEVTVQGAQQASLMDLGIEAGDHTLSILYLERGSSMSNCSIYFNLAPRFGLQIRKEDVLTQQLLDGTQFTVYEDPACTQPATLWESEEAYNLDLADGVLDSSRSTFTVINGVASLWGLGSGNTYYIKETGAPNTAGYGVPEGVIRLTLEKDGMATYHVDVIPDAQGNEPSNGFTVHDVRIDEETKTVYFVATNAPESVIETTTVQVIKKWEDTKSHAGDYIQAYLTVTDPDGTVRRIRQITLSDENQWTYTWTNLPKYDYNAMTEVQYGVEESYESGYYSTVRRITQIEIIRTQWAEATSFLSGESYLLKHSSGYLSTVSASDARLTWAAEETAQNSPLALWTATVSGGKVKFTNGAGQTLSFNYSSGSNNRYFYATAGSATYQSFTPVDAGSGFRFYVTRSYRNYYMSSGGINSSGRIPSVTSSSSGLILTPMKRITQIDIQPAGDWAYQITNVPLAAENETALSVKKEWVIPPGYSAELYQEYAVTVRLLANGDPTGRTLTLTLKNNWEGSFLGLPYTDAGGNVIAYSVDEVWEKEKWATIYGPVTSSGGAPPVYSTTITNTYHPGGPELPSTGSPARLMYMLCGGAMMLAPLVYGIGSRRKRERRSQ